MSSSQSAGANLKNHFAYLDGTVIASRRVPVCPPDKQVYEGMITSDFARDPDKGAFMCLDPRLPAEMTHVFPTTNLTEKYIESMSGSAGQTLVPCQIHNWNLSKYS
jgi:hypothetical protein